jgi:hypothetical protein
MSLHPSLPSPRRSRWHSARIALVSMAIAATSSCAIAAESGEKGELPDSKSFIDSGVSEFMEKRCGGIDCHGQPGRPLRIYSEWGLRQKTNKDGTRVTGTTTNEERLANYRSVVGLEPEALEACYRSKGQISDFQLLLKPLGPESNGIRHKGGPVLRPTSNDPGWQCLYGWVSGNVSPTECANAAKVSN